MKTKEAKCIDPHLSNFFEIGVICPVVEKEKKWRGYYYRLIEFENLYFDTEKPMKTEKPNSKKQETIQKDYFLNPYWRRDDSDLLDLFTMDSLRKLAKKYGVPIGRYKSELMKKLCIAKIPIKISIDI